jgi:N6-L-threonylcarbamoyladenine synthase
VGGLAAGFQEAVVDVLVTKTLDAAKREGVNQILLGGGVAANALLRRTMVERSPIEVIVPPPSLCTDNGAMIAACAFYRLRRESPDGWDLEAVPNLKLV